MPHKKHDQAHQPLPVPPGRPAGKQAPARTREVGSSSKQKSSGEQDPTRMPNPAQKLEPARNPNTTRNPNPARNPNPTREPESWKRVRAAMRERGEATRPQLARATGLSQVLVGKVVAGMCAAGELQSLGEVSSGGGRPVELYRYLYRPAVYFRAEAQGALLSGRLELLNHRGDVRHSEQAQFAMLHEQSLDDWLDALTRRHPLESITLEIPPGTPAEELRRHLQQRYLCPVRQVTPAMVLADEQENTITLCLPIGKEPTASIRRGSRSKSCGRLGLLPQPASWESLDYEDHTLVEEMIARLLLMLTCTLAPTGIILYAGFWTDRLTSRIRYNLSAKLKEAPAPRLNFRSITTAELDQRRRRYSQQHGN